jgi:hypothetical protein
MSEKPEQQPIIVIERARLSFPRIFTAQYRTDPKTGERKGKAKYSATLLLDPTDKGQAASITVIKTAAFNACLARWGSKENFPKADPRTGMGGLILPFGNGNDLPKVYDGYKDMFFVKLSDTNPPAIGNLAGQFVKEGEPECPYGGCYVRARISAWTYARTPQNPDSANGANFNFRSLQFAGDGAAFGGGGVRTADEEFVNMAGDRKAATAALDDDIAF